MGLDRWDIKLFVLIEEEDSWDVDALGRRLGLGHREEQDVAMAGIIDKI